MSGEKAPIVASFSGRTIRASAGQSVAAALLASGEVTFRRTATDEPRGLFCGMGVCFDCMVTIDGKPHQRACMTALSDGMRIEPDRGLAADPSPGIMGARERSCDLLVIGGGPAGLAGATAAAQAGLDVVLVDERSALGGQYYKQPAGPAAPAPDAQARRGAARVDAARSAGVELLSGVAVWAAFDSGTIAAVSDDTRWLFRPKRLLLATGAYENAVPFPGWTLPGVMTTGAAQGLARAHGVVPGQRVVVAGNGPLNLQAACELKALGARIVAVVEAASRPSLRDIAAIGRLAVSAPDLLLAGLSMRARLAATGTPVIHASAVTAASGNGRVEQVTIAPIGSDGRVRDGRQHRLEADVLCVGYGFQPSNELSRALDCTHAFDQRFGHLRTDRDEDGRSSAAGVFVAGDAAGLGGARLAEIEGALAGLAIARDLGRPAAAPARLRPARARARAFQDALWTLFAAPVLTDELATDDTLLCRCESVSFGQIRAAVAGGAGGLGAIKRLTRAGMGRCQGRLCGRIMVALCAKAANRLPTELDFFAPRTPARPVAIGTIAADSLPPMFGHEKT